MTRDNGLQSGERSGQRSGDLVEHHAPRVDGFDHYDPPPRDEWNADTPPAAKVLAWLAVAGFFGILALIIWVFYSLALIIWKVTI